MHENFNAIDIESNSQDKVRHYTTNIIKKPLIFRIQNLRTDMT